MRNQSKGQDPILFNDILNLIKLFFQGSRSLIKLAQQISFLLVVIVCWMLYITKASGEWKHWSLQEQGCQTYGLWTTSSPLSCVVRPIGLPEGSRIWGQDLPPNTQVWSPMVVHVGSGQIPTLPAYPTPIVMSKSDLQGEVNLMLLN